MAFLSRIPCAPAHHSRAMFWYGTAGLVIGLICTSFSLVFHCIIPRALPSLSALVGGWLWVAAEAWLTRGLHWDGVADIGDALGSGTQGEKFWGILKDSHLGAFGAMALILILVLQALAVALHLAKGTTFSEMLPLVFAPAWSRLTVIWLAYGGKGAPASFLGKSICAQVTNQDWIWASTQGVLILCACLPICSLLALLSLLAAQMGLTWRWRYLGRQCGGLSGDFFGCHIELSQTLFLVFTAA